ncbi:hypothetical protein EKG37_17095 [Robertmurraya yapensis]|uniref:Oxalate:formate antiporter n=2 Tax=Bacillaceae TaxID=186817 RepID=A0A431VYX6_9BACI|nr:hypothetical protein [Bacillus yapensis]RTR28461.1 hypothetical protein EKG37_17095 [Bacillus yapensis]TKS94522.1 hypothetical protein FAR12_17095 [Bacillus yapensis]
MKKNNSNQRDLVYVHLNETKQYVLSYGIEYPEFAQSLSDLMHNVLLLKHHFDDGDFNMHTLLEFVPNERLNNLAKDDVYGYGDFCWIDFEEEEGLNELTGQELAELLYLGHMKDHLKPPFYHRLRNRFVYLAHDDGWWNKVYYRNIRDFYRMLGDVLAGKMKESGLEKNLLGLKKKRDFPSVSMELLLNMKQMMKEGILISFHDTVQTRTSIEIPIWVLGDFDNMDDMYEEYENVARGKYDAKLLFDKKTREWKMYSN